MNKITNIIIIIIFVVLSYDTSIYGQDSLKGHWNFDNKNDWQYADVGNNLRYVGSKIRCIDTKDYYDGAIYIPYQNYLIVDHNILPNGGDSLVNEYTIVMDILVAVFPRSYAILQTDTTNSNNAVIFIQGNAQIGSDELGYSSENLMKKNSWYRLAISIKNGSFAKFYLDGELVFTGNTPNIDGSLALKKSALLFADNDNEDNSINIADLKFFSKALNDSEIEALGGYDNSKKMKFIEPYLQTPTANSIYICWHTEKLGSKLYYGSTDQLGTEIIPDYYEFKPGLIWNWVRIENLENDSPYYYQIVTDHEDLFGNQSKIHRFRTQPLATSQKAFRFVLLADNRSNPLVHKAVNEKIIETLKSRFGKDFEDSVNIVFNLGDIVGSGNTLYKYQEEYFDGIKDVSCRIPFMVTIGNHENESEFYYHYMKYEDYNAPEGEKYFAFQLSRIKFLMLNTNIRGETQLDWMKNELIEAENDNSVDWVFVFSHHCEYTETWQKMDDGRIWALEKIIPNLKKFSKVVMFGSGHVHSYSRGAYPKYNFWITTNGSAAASLDRWADRPTELKDFEHIIKTFDQYGYSIVDIDIANKKMNVKRYSIGHEDKKLNNKIIDEYQYTLGDTLKPNVPFIKYPDNNSTIDSPITINITGYEGSNYDVLSAQYKICDIYDSTICDTLLNYVDVFKDSGFPDYEPINQFQNRTLDSATFKNDYFVEGNTYSCSVRYRNKNLVWSDWSNITNFTVGKLTNITKCDLVDQTFNLYQNNPNPFNPSTIISFSVPESGLVILKVYNVLGQEVSELVNDVKSAGRYKVTFDASNLSSGVYIYTIKAGKYTSTKKMMLLK